MLDGLFVVLILHFFVTGSIVPSPLIDLFRDQPQIVVSTEPVHVPRHDSESAPLIDEGDVAPETRKPLLTAPQTDL